jgi:sulfofructose kinase
LSKNEALKLLSATPYVICIGSAVWDTIFYVESIPGEGIKLLPKAAKQIASGMAGSAAASIARLEQSVRLWSMVGDDLVGNQLLAELHAEGVDTSGSVTVPGAQTPFSSILIDANGERLVVPYFSFTSDQQATSVNQLPLHLIKGSGAVLADVRWPQAVIRAFALAKECGVPSVLDADVASLPVLEQLAPLADHVLFSESALGTYTGCADPTRALEIAAISLPDAKVIGVTLGARGSLIFDRTCVGAKTGHVPSIKIQCVDTLGAGDVWHGAYCYGLVKQLPTLQIAELANTSAAMKCEQAWGRLGAPRITELRRRLIVESLAPLG